MENLKELAITKVNQRVENSLKEIETTEGLKKVLMWEGKTYKGNIKEKLKKHLENKRKKEVKQINNRIKEVSEAEGFETDLIITIEWKKSNMWGKNPKAYTNFGFEGSSIGGCGYCKQSTATAQALNSDLRILKLLFVKKEKWLKENKKQEFTKDIKRDYLGYGSGYGVLPYFEGGVGVNSHKQIIEKLGLKMDTVTSTSNTDVYRVYKV